MLPSKLREIQERLQIKGTQISSSEKPLLEELNKLDAFFGKLKQPRPLNEGIVKEGMQEIFGVTSGPDGYCSACGKKL